MTNFRGFISCLLILTCACASEQNTLPDSKGGKKADGPSAHIMGDVTNGLSAFQWIDVEESALETYRKTIFPPPQRGRLLATDEARTRKLQDYVDRIDEHVRRTQPELVDLVPKPSIRIYEDDFLNAWASGAPVCMNAPVTFDDAAPGAKEYHSVLMHHNSIRAQNEFSEGGGFFGEPPAPLVDCIQAEYSDDVEEFVDWMNEKRGGCEYDYRGGRIHISGESCQLMGGSDDFGSAKNARFYAVIPVVFITTAYMDFIGDEEQVASVVAHELAHYYKSHATNAEFMLRGDLFHGDDTFETSFGYNYFYTQTRIPEPVKPRRRADSDDIRAKVLRFMRNQANPFKGVQNTKLETSLGRFIVNFSYRNELPSFPACANAHRLLNENDAVNYPYKKELSADEKRHYLRLESAFLDCSDSLSVPQDLPFSKIESAFSSLMKAELVNIEGNGSMRSIVERINEQMETFSREEREFYDFLRDEHIGYYTAEQEADEVGAELLDAIGMPAIAHALTSLHGGRFRESEAPENFERVNGITMDRCEELFENDWIDPATGEYVFIPIGSLEGIHHGPCYRAFNISREIEAHGYDNEPGDPVVDEFSFEKSGTIEAREQVRFVLENLKSGTYEFRMSGTGDADLYVRIDDVPTTRTYDCRPYESGSDEVCVVEVDSSVHIMVRGYAPSSDFKLVGEKR